MIQLLFLLFAGSACHPSQLAANAAGIDSAFNSSLRGIYSLLTPIDGRRGIVGNCTKSYASLKSYLCIDSHPRCKCSMNVFSIKHQHVVVLINYKAQTQSFLSEIHSFQMSQLSLKGLVSVFCIIFPDWDFWWKWEYECLSRWSSTAFIVNKDSF